MQDGGQDGLDDEVQLNKAKCKAVFVNNS